MPKYPLLRRSGFGLLEMMLVFILVLGAALVVFTLYTAARVNATAGGEESFVGAAMANAKATFQPDHYVAVNLWWRNAQASGKAWTESPAAWPYRMDGWNPGHGGCGVDPCPTVAMSLYYRDNPQISEKACYKFFLALSREFFIDPGNYWGGPLSAGMRPTPVSGADLASYCDRSKTPPYMWTIVMPF